MVSFGIFPQMRFWCMRAFHVACWHMLFLRRLISKVESLRPALQNSHFIVLFSSSIVVLFCMLLLERDKLFGVFLDGPKDVALWSPYNRRFVRMHQQLVYSRKGARLFGNRQKPLLGNCASA